MLADPFGGAYLSPGQSPLPPEDPFRDLEVEAEIQAGQASSATAGGEASACASSPPSPAPAGE
eukprot:4726901-Lingulodinium_polyedra.AAC.1